MKKTVVVVTGVSGQDGSHMVDYLLKNTDKILNSELSLLIEDA